MNAQEYKPGVGDFLFDYLHIVLLVLVSVEIFVRYRMKRPIGRPDFLAVGVIVAVSLVASGIINYQVWGFVLKRPGVLDIVAEIEKVDSASMLELDSFDDDPLRFVPTKETVQHVLLYRDVYPYHIMYHRAAHLLADQGSFTLPVSRVSEEIVENLFALLDESGKLEKGEPGHDSTGYLEGLVLAGQNSDKEEILFVGMRGWQVSNDHYPYYDFAFVREDGEYKLHSFQRWYFDIAGWEIGEPLYELGFTIVEWPISFIIVVVPFLLLFFIPLTAVFGYLGNKKQKKTDIESAP